MVGSVFPILSFLIGEWHSIYLLTPLFSLLFAELLLSEVQMTLQRATHLLKNVWGSTDKDVDLTGNLRQMKLKLKEVLLNYSAKKTVESVLKQHEGLEESLNEEIILHGKVKSGLFIMGEIWNKPEGVRNEGPAQRTDLGYKTKLRLWKHSVAVAQQELEALENNLIDRSEKGLAGIIRFQILMLNDKSVQNQVKRGLSNNVSFSEGLKKTFDEMCMSLKNPNPRLDRSADMKDLEQRLLDISARSQETSIQPNLDLSGKIILSKQLMPTEVLQYSQQGACGFITIKGQETSHAHIIQASMGIPTVSGFDVGDLDFPDGTPVILDGSKGRVFIRPSQEEIELYRDMIIKSNLERGNSDCRLITLGDERIHIRGNLSVLSELQHIKASCAEGIGLFRTELEFMLRPVLPNRQEQVVIYKSVIDACPPGMATLRLLDAGGDKLGYYSNDLKEENPSMGKRSIRFLLSEKDVLITQMSAMVEALKEKGGTILVPMVSHLEEARTIRELFIRILSEYGLKEKGHIALGVMVETPAMVVMFDKLLPYFEKVSIGSNDLVQYTLAADRNNSAVADVYTRISPAVLRMIHSMCVQARKEGKVISLCGELGHNVELMPVLIGMGLREFSINYMEIQGMRTFIEKLDMKHCEDLAKQVLECEVEEEILTLLKEFESIPA